MERLTAFVSDTTMALVEDGELRGPRLGNVNGLAIRDGAIDSDL
jgi:hypothetical protein